jgi:hypothetical protein
MIHTLKKRYNQTNPSLITSNTIPGIVNQLQKKIRTCDNEICWLDSLGISNASQVKKEFFVPDQPITWKKKKRKWLTNFDIMHVMKQYEEKDNTFVFLGPSYIDFDTVIADQCVDQDICTFSLLHYKKHQNKFGFVFNLDNHKGPGTHWVALFVNVQDAFIYYFDSTGHKIPREITTLVQRIIQEGKQLSISFSMHDNHKKKHQYLFTECGMYCMYFLITMLDSSLTKKKKIALFKQTTIPDTFVEKLRKVYFNPITE